MEFSIHCRNFGLHAPFLFASATPVLHEGKRTEVLVIPTCAGMTGERSHRNSEVVRFSLHHRACHEERSSKPWDAALISDAADSVSVSSSVPRCSHERALTRKHERFVAEESVSGYQFPAAAFWTGKAGGQWTSASTNCAMRASPQSVAPMILSASRPLRSKM